MLLCGSEGGGSHKYMLTGLAFFRTASGNAVMAHKPATTEQSDVIPWIRSALFFIIIVGPSR